MSTVYELLARPCIERSGPGFSEKITFDEFVLQAVQDDVMAYTIAKRMLAGQDPYPYNETDPEFYEEFTVSPISLVISSFDAG